MIDSAREVSRSIQYWGVPWNRFGCNFLQDGVQRGSARFRPVDKEQRFQVRVNARPERKFRQRGTYDGAIQNPSQSLDENSRSLR